MIPPIPNDDVASANNAKSIGDSNASAALSLSRRSGNAEVLTLLAIRPGSDELVNPLNPSVRVTDGGGDDGDMKLTGESVKLGSVVRKARGLIIADCHGSATALLY